MQEDLSKEATMLFHRVPAKWKNLSLGLSTKNVYSSKFTQKQSKRNTDNDPKMHL